MLIKLNCISLDCTYFLWLLFYILFKETIFDVNRWYANEMNWIENKNDMCVDGLLNKCEPVIHVMYGLEAQRGTRKVYKDVTDLA